METTQKFERLPPLAGVHFAGLEDVTIESRRSVAKQLRNFMRYCFKEATSPAVQVILGEWGEGKTEVYERYIQPKASDPHHAYFVSASTVANSLTKVEAESPLASKNLLMAVFYAIQHEAKADLIPSYQRFVETDRWLDEIFHAHAGGKIFIFIDEFEELILNPPALKTILSGLKELINKQYPAVTEKGQYPGILFFFLACTPDAYARMQRDPEITEVFGSWERRIDKIHLAPVTKWEGVKFMHDLMRYAYNARLPTPLPVKDIGVFHTLQTIGRGNLGALVTLFVRLFNSAAVDDRKMRVIDGARTLDILGDETISIYGANAPCVERSFLENLEKLLEEGETELLRLLAGELRPFSLVELEARMEGHTATEISALVGRINRELVEVGIDSAITQFAPIRLGPSFDDLQEVLGPEIRGTEVRIDSYAQQLSELENDLTFVELRGGELVPRVFFPWDSRMISAEFQGVTLNSARRLERRLGRIVDERELYYSLSKGLIFQLFPTPIPLELEFIKDRDYRLSAWRDMTARLPQSFRDNGARAFVDLVSEVEVFDIEVDDVRSMRRGLAGSLHDTTQDAVIQAWCYAHYGNLTDVTVREIEEVLEELGAHVAVVIHIGEFTDEGQEELHVREMENRILHIPLHTNLAKRLLISHRYATRHPNQINDRLFADSIAEFFKREIELSTRIKEWLRKGTQTGIVLEDLYKATARGERDLADSLKFYINRLGQPTAPEKIFETNERLMSFVPFGFRAGFIPDIESEDQLVRYTEDLAENGFVRWDPDRTVHVLTTPPEIRIIRILDEGPIAKADVGKHFINCAQAKNILDDVYLNILKHKGVVSETRGLIEPVQVQQALERAENQRNKYRKLLESRKQQEEWSTFAHVFVTKQRDSRFILISEVEAYLEELYQDIQSASLQNQKDVVLQRAALLSDLADHLESALIPKVDGAVREAKLTKDETLEQVDSLLTEIQDVTDLYNRWMNQDAALEDIAEVKWCREAREHIEDIYSASFNADDVTEHEGKNIAFRHQGWSKGDRHFNIALSRLRESSASLHKQVKKAEGELKDVQTALKALAEAGQEIRSHFQTVRVAEDYRLSKAVHVKLEAFFQSLSASGPKPMPESEGAAPALTLGKMKQDLRELHAPIDKRYRRAEKAIQELQGLVEVETEFRNERQSYSETYQRFAKMADAEPFQTEVRGLKEIATQTISQYKSLVEELEGSEMSKVVDRETISSAKMDLEQRAKELSEITESLVSVWKEYVNGCQQFVRSILRLAELVKLHDSSLSTGRVEAQCRQLLKATNLEDQKWPEKSMSHYDGVKREIRKSMMQHLEKGLDEAAGTVLLAVLERDEQSEDRWFELPRITHEIADDVGVNQREVEEQVRSLVQKGYLTEGIAIPT